MAIYRGPGGAGDATADVTNEAEAVALAVAAAEEAQAAAELAQTGAETAETNAETYANSAAASLVVVTNLASATSSYTTIASEAAASAAADLTTIIGYTSAASNYATSAASSAASAAADLTVILNYKSAAETYSITASNAASAASSYAIAAGNAYDSFDDRYLGAKSSAPTVDNDGDALVTGALYYNTSVGQLYIWNGTAWDDAAFNASGSVLSFNTRTGAVTLSSTDVTDALGYTPVQTETDPVVGAITGIVKANGAGTISAAVSGTDYQAPLTAGTDYLAPSAIGVSVQGYDADTAKYDDVTANFTGTLQNGGHTVLTNASDYLDSADIGVSVQSYNANTVITDSTQTLTNKTISGASNTLTVDGTNPVGFLDVPPVGTKTTSYSLQTSDVGKYVQIGSGGSITIPDATFSEGDVISLFNNTAGDITITCSITTAYIAGTDTDVASATLATRGICTILFISGTVCTLMGNVS